ARSQRRVAAAGGRSRRRRPGAAAFCSRPWPAPRRSRRSEFPEGSSRSTSPGPSKSSEAVRARALLVDLHVRPSRRRFTRHGLIVATVIVVLIGVGVLVAYTFLDEPLRRYTEAKMNARLEGYSVSIGKLHFSPVNFSLDLRNLVIVQNAQPDPPVANIERLYASVHWRALLAGRVV